MNIFVYGTLKQRCSRGYIIQYSNGVFIGTGTIKGTLKVLPYGYPGYIEEGNDIIAGELYSFDDDSVMNQFDLIEGYDPNATDPLFNLYIRKECEIDVKGTKYKAWVYVWNHPFPDDSTYPNCTDNVYYF